MEDAGYDETRFLTCVEEDLHCGICTDILREPKQCQRNEHHFCTSCINRHLETSKKCPLCLEELSVHTAKRPSRLLLNRLSPLQIHCDNYTRGCPEIIKLENLATHVSNCGFEPVKCTNSNCSEIINRQDKRCHELLDCRYRLKASCQNCVMLESQLYFYRVIIISIIFICIGYLIESIKNEN